MDNSNLRQHFVGESSDGELDNKIFNHLNVDSGEKALYNYENFLEFLYGVQQTLQVDPDYLNCKNAELSIQAISRFIAALNNNLFSHFENTDSSNQTNFKASESLLRKVVYSAVYFPDDFGLTWGFKQRDKRDSQANPKEFQLLMDSFVNKTAQAVAKREIRASLTVAQVFRDIQDLQILDMLGTLGYEMWLDVEKNVDLESYRDQPETFKLISKLKGMGGGIANKIVNSLLDDEKVEKAKKDILDAEEQGNLAALLIEAELGQYMSQIAPLAGKSRVKKSESIELVLVNDKQLIHAIKTAIFEAEGRYVGEQYFTGNSFEDLSKSKRPRIVPKAGVSPYRALSLEEVEELGIEVEDNLDYVVLNDLPLFSKFSTRELEGLNKRIDYCLGNNEELVFYIPTCPCDQHAINEDGVVYFTDGPLVGGISWTGGNTITAVEALIQSEDFQHLIERGLNVRFVFATGDIEFVSGNTRGMDKSSFNETLDMNHTAIASLLASRLEIPYMTIGQREDTLQPRELRGIKGINIDIDGIIRIAGGEEEWHELTTTVAPIVSEFLNDEKNVEIVQAVMAARTTLYGIRITNLGLEVNTENMKRELAKDLYDYCTFHQLAINKFGDKTTIMLTADSHALETLASKIMGTYLLTVQGNYDGSAPVEVKKPVEMEV